jgi:hypothetical protein
MLDFEFVRSLVWGRLIILVSQRYVIVIVSRDCAHVV